MAVRNILKKSDSEKKSISKTFRLREKAKIALDSLSEVTGISQNEIANMIFEESLGDILIIAEIEKTLEDLAHYDKGHNYRVRATFVSGGVVDKIIMSFIIYNTACVMYEVIELIPELDKRVLENKVKVGLPISKISELLDYGLNSNYKISIEKKDNIDESDEDN